MQRNYSERKNIYSSIEVLKEILKERGKYESRRLEGGCKDEAAATCVYILHAANVNKNVGPVLFGPTISFHFLCLFFNSTTFGDSLIGVIYFTPTVKSENLYTNYI